MKLHTSYPTQWIGLKPVRFRKYRTWINNQKPGICGTYVSAVLLHDTYLHRYGVDVSKEKLLKGLKSVIDDTFPYRGTFPWDLWHGLNTVLKGNPDYQAKMLFVPDKKIVELLNQPDPMPVAVGTTRLLGSRYKNHWVLVYAYGYNKKGKLFLKAYDNHGRSTAILPASQTFGCVWLSAKNKQ